MKIEKVDEDCDSKEMNYDNSKQQTKGSKQYTTNAKTLVNNNSNKAYNSNTTPSSYNPTKIKTNKSYNVKTTPSSYKSSIKDNPDEHADQHFDAIFDKYSKDVTTKKDTSNDDNRSYDITKANNKDSKQDINSAYDSIKQESFANSHQNDQSLQDSNEIESKSNTLKGIESFLSKSYSHNIPINSLEHDSYHPNANDLVTNKGNMKTSQIYPASLYEVLNGSLTDSIDKKKELEKDIYESKLAVQKLTNDMKDHNLYPSSLDGSGKDSTVYKDDTSGLLVDVELSDQVFNDDWKTPIQQSGICVCKFLLS